MSNHKIVEVTATHVCIVGGPEMPGSHLIEKTDSWRACFKGTKRHLGYYVLNENAPDGWASTDDIEAAIDPPYAGTAAPKAPPVPVDTVSDEF